MLSSRQGFISHPKCVRKQVMPMKIEGSENVCSVFSIFHDGSIVSCISGGGDLQFEVQIQYLAERVNPNFRKFNVRLFFRSEWSRILDLAR